MFPLAICALLSSVRGAADPSLVGWWRFDEGRGGIVKDWSGKGNDGRIHGARWVEGIFGFGLLFDGKDDYVNCGDSPSLRLTEAITIEAWMKPRGLDAWPGVSKERSYSLGDLEHARREGKALSPNEERKIREAVKNFYGSGRTKIVQRTKEDDICST